MPAPIILFHKAKLRESGHLVSKTIVVDGSMIVV